MIQYTAARRHPVDKPEWEVSYFRYRFSEMNQVVMELPFHKSVFNGHYTSSNSVINL